MRYVLACSTFALSLALAAGAAAQVCRPMPVVQRIQPTAGPPGTTVSLLGRYFDREQTVWLGETQLPVQSRLPNRWTVTVPEGARSGRLTVRTPRGDVRGPRFRVSERAPAPRIAAVEPSEGAAGTEVTLTGENFSPRVSENQVRLGDRPVVVRNANPAELRVIVPAGASTAPFRVRVTGAGETTSPEPFRVGAGTTIVGFEPTVGPPGTRVTLRGTGFDARRGRNRVYLGERRARVRSASETELEVEVPRRGAETARWLVDVRGSGRAQSEAAFEVRSPPEITAMEPGFGAPGGRVTLRGAHFGDDVQQVEATLGERRLRLRDLADDHLVVEIPEGAETGPVEVTVRGLGPARSEPLRIVERVSLEGFTPRSGGAGTEVRLHGRGFAASPEHNTVTISGQRAEVLRASPTELVIRAPDARSGPVAVAVTNAGEDRSTQPFVVTRVPEVVSFTPTSGPPGTAVTVRGRNFGTRRGLVRVTIGERNAQVVRVTDEELRVVIPDSAQTGNLAVGVRMQGRAESEEAFEVTD